MKAIAIYLFLSLFGGVFSQSNNGSKIIGEIFTITEEMPEYPGGVKEMMLFIQKNITYPASCRQNNLGGKVFLKFVINTEGNLTDAIVLKSTGISELDEEALRVVRMMPKWKPGSQDGKPVNVYFNLPVNFSISVPYYMFNINNTNAAYLSSKDLLEKGDVAGSYVILKKECEQSDNIDLLYNLAVSFYDMKLKKDACVYFKKITELTNDKFSTVLNNSKEFLQKYCNN